MGRQAEQGDENELVNGSNNNNNNNKVYSDNFVCWQRASACPPISCVNYHRVLGFTPLWLTLVPIAAVPETCQCNQLAEGKIFFRNRLHSHLIISLPLCSLVPLCLDLGPQAPPPPCYKLELSLSFWHNKQTVFLNFFLTNQLANSRKRTNKSWVFGHMYESIYGEPGWGVWGVYKEWGTTCN